MDTEQSVALLAARVTRLESAVDARLAALEGQVGALAGALAGSPIPGSPGRVLPPPIPPPPVPPPPAPPPAPGPAPTAAAGPSFEVGVEVLLRWAGIALVALAALFLVSTAISRGWIGPELQLLGAAVIGGGLLVGALRLAPGRLPWARALAIGGAVVLPVCAGAGYSWLDLYHPVVGLLLVAVSVGATVAVAIELRLESVAATATGSMLVVPTLARIIEDGPVVATGVWLALFAVVAAVVGVRQGWITYKLSSTWAVALWVTGLAVATADADHVVEGVVLVAVVGAVLWLNPTLTSRLIPEPADGNLSLRATEAGSPLLVPLWAWVSVLGFAALDIDDPGGWIGLALAAGFLILAAVAGPITGLLRDDMPVYHVLGAGALAAVAAAVWLDGPTLALVLAFQALGAVAAGVGYDERLLRFKGYGLAAISGLLTIGGLRDVLEDAIPRGTDASLEAGPTLARTVVVVVLAAVAHLTGRSGERDVAEPMYGAVAVIAVGLVGSVVAPVVEGSAWLFVGTGCGLVALVAGRRFGPFVDGVGVLVGAATVVGAASNIIRVADDGGGLVDHLGNLSAVVALGLVTVVAPRVGPIEARRPLFVATWILTLAWVASVLLGLPQGHVLVSVAWALAACGALVAGIRSGEAIVRTTGLVTLVVVLAKLLTIDLAAVDTFWRVGLFLVIGLGMLRLAYVLPELARRYRHDADYVDAR